MYNEAQKEVNRQSTFIVHHSFFYELTKRTIDLVVSMIGLMILSPIFIVIVLMIKLTDQEGTVFFKQERIGKDGEPFVMYKFRTMVSNAETMLPTLQSRNEAGACMFKIKDDPRITLVGKWMRRASLDELPQLVNVFRGEMSLVGPRPPLRSEVAHYNQHQLKRLLVKPGCSGLWQVTARNDVGFEEMVQLDLEYMKNRTIMMDLKIMLKTVMVMIKMNGQ